MGKAIINKHIDSVNDITLSSLFDSDKDKSKGEIIICNDPENPTIYIMDKNNEPKKIAGGSDVDTSYDDSKIWEEVKKNSAEIENLKDNCANSTIPEQITVAGLDGQFGAGNYKNGDIIDANTDVYTILQNILCKELYPTDVKPIQAKANANMKPLTLSLDKSGTVEVGTLVKLIEGKTNGCSVSVTQKSQITGMEFGYYKEDDDTTYYSDKSIVNNCETVEVNYDYTISVSDIEGFDADTTVYVQTLPDEQFGEHEVSLLETNIGCVSEGENKLTITATGSTYSYSSDAIGKVYYCSNLYKTDASKYYAEVEAVNGQTNQATGTASVSVTGVYYYFMGYSENTDYTQFDSDSIRNLTIKCGEIKTNGDTTIVPSGTVEVSNGKSVVIACPASYELKSIKYSNQADMLQNFKSGNIPVKTGEIETVYKVYICPITNNAQVEFTNVVLGKIKV